MPLQYAAFSCMLFMGIASLAQEALLPRRLQAQKIDRNLEIDGVLNEPEWMAAPVATGFQLNFPSDTVLASGKTFVRVLYNDRFLYIAAVLENSRAGHSYVVSSLRRDYPFMENDAFGVIIDPFNDHTNGYGFYVSAYGIQREEQIYNGTMADAVWDIKWYTAVKQIENGWIAELAIPLRYIRFSHSIPAWNINFLRNDIGNNELSSWAATPRNFLFPHLSYSGELLLQEIPGQRSGNVSLIPGITFNASQVMNEKIDTKLKPSLDAKIALTSSLNLDLTVNPDFSQAEVDDAQINLTRFELSYPEKRLFFIENSDLFSEFGVKKGGTALLRPFYSRRIGLKYNKATGQFGQTSVIAGARVSGKLNKDLRIGLMSIQTAASDPGDHIAANGYFPSQNYSVVALQQKVFSSSNIGLIITSRQAFGTDSTSHFQLAGNDFNRLVGMEYNLISRNGQWTGKLFEHVMFNDSTTSSAQGGWLNYSSKTITGWVGITKAGKDFAPDVGFTPRNNFRNAYAEWGYQLYPSRGIINMIKPLAHYSIYMDKDHHCTDHAYRIGSEILFRNTADSYILFLGDYTRLLQPFNPALDGGKKLDAGTAYSYKSFSLYYISDLRKKIAGEFYLQTGEYFNGHFTQVVGYFTYKIQPLGTVGFRYNFNFVRLPAPYSSNDLVAIGPKLDLSLSRKLFLSSNVQYASLNDNINYFFRLQYRFRPLSDIYLVYGNNENTKTWERQDQSLILKVTYFF